MNKSRSIADKRVSQLPNWLWSNSNVLPTSYRRIWEAVREERPHLGPAKSELLVDTKKVFPLLLTSQLPTEVLGYIWGLANQKYAGKLTEQELYVVLALVAVAQTSYPFTNLEVLHLLPGPPEPRLNLAPIFPNASQIAAHQDVSLRNDAIVAKNEIQGRTTYKASSASSGISIPGLVPDRSRSGETRIDSKIPCMPVPLSKASSDVVADSREASPARSDGKISRSSESVDSNDDFSEFQSAPPPTHQTAPSVPIWDTKQGSAIGSRLANHNLGVKKTSDKQRKASFGGGTGSKTHGLSRGVSSMAEKTNVSTPGGSKESLSGAERLGEIFPKCAVKNQAKTVILKDTVIRNNDPPERIKDSTGSVAIEKGVPSARQLSAKFAASSSSSNAESSPLDLMNLQQAEDKYSALRVLVEEPNPVVTVPQLEAIGSTGSFPQADDFGDFVSAQQPDALTTSSINVVATSSFGYGDTSDLFSDLDRFRSTPAAKKLADPLQNLDTVSEAFGNLGIETPSATHFPDEKYDGAIETEKAIPKEDTISVNSIDLGNGTVGVITRSNSVPSLDLKSFLSPSAEDEQHQAENMHQLIYWEWKQYMESCVQLLQTAANVFGSITSDVVLQEVLASAQGYNFLCNLAEVAAVCRRVNFSHKEMDINIMGFDDLLMDIDRIWAEMEPFYSNIPIVTELPVWPLHQGESSACCALCLTIVTGGRIVYNDNSYHVTCANLWLNCVNHNLPTLRYPPSSFVSHSIPVTATGNNQI